MTSYWVVGAMYSGNDDQLEVFLRRGIWMLGWSAEQKPEMALQRDRIAVGDRIAVKKMLGQGSREIEIRAIGVVIDVDANHPDHTIFVRWTEGFNARSVQSAGCFGSIHGPYTYEDDWTRSVFCL